MNKIYLLFLILIFVIFEIDLIKNSKQFKRFCLTHIPNMKKEVIYEFLIYSLRIIALIPLARELKIYNILNIFDSVVVLITSILGILTIVFAVMVFVIELILNTNSREVFSRLRYIEIDTRSMSLSILLIFMQAITESVFFAYLFQIGSYYSFISIVVYVIYKIAKSKDAYIFLLNFVLSLSIALVIFSIYTLAGCLLMFILLLIINFAMAFKE